jgi:O-antigen/teichoic acid export membrane protein
LIYLTRFGVRLVSADTRIARQYLSYSLPLMPGTIAIVLSARADRYVLAYFQGLGEVGVYTLCFTVTSLGPALFASISDVLLPEMADLYDNGEWQAFYTRFAAVHKFLLGCSVGMAALCIAFPAEVLRLVTPVSYPTASLTLGLLAIHAAAAAIANLYALLLNIRLRVWSRTLVYSSMGAVVLVLDLLLVPRFGAQGAAMSQLTAAVLGVAGLAGLNTQTLRETWMPIWLFQCSVAFTTVCLIARIFLVTQISLAHSLLRLTVGISFFVLALVATGFLNKEDFRPFIEAASLKRTLSGGHDCVERTDNADG